MNSEENREIRVIIDYISSNKIATVCCTDQHGLPHCFHCFYVFEEKHQLLFFKSSTQASHSQMIAENHGVAGSILPQKLELMALKGIQFTGTVLYNDIPGQVNPETFYYKILPLGLTKPGRIYCIRLDTIKMTDNSALRGNKLHWNRLELA